MAAKDTSKGKAAGQADKAASSLDSVAGGSLKKQKDLFKIPSGIINSFEPPIAITDRISTSPTSSPFGALKAAVRKSNQVDTVTGKSETHAIVLRVENPKKDVSTTSIMSSMMEMLGLTPEKPLRKAKVLIPEMHGRILIRPDGPGHPKYPSQKNMNDKIIDLYPTAECIGLDPEFDQIAVGDLVSIEFPSKNNFSTSGMPLITAIKNKGAPPASTGFCNDSNTYQANPPAGDALPGGQLATGHTGKDGHALRARKKRVAAQLLAHKESGEQIMLDVASLLESKGYNSLVPPTLPDGVSTKKVNKDMEVLQHIDYLSNMIPNEDLFVQNVEMLTIIFRKVHEEGVVSSAEERYRMRNIFISLIDTIDKKTGGKPIINFVYDSAPGVLTDALNYDHHVKVQDAINNFLPNDPDFANMVNLARIFFYDTHPYYTGKNAGEQASLVLSSDESAVFVQDMMQSFVVAGSDPSPVENKRPGPEAIPVQQPANPEGFMAPEMLTEILMRAEFPPEPGLAEAFLKEVARRLGLENVEDLQGLESDNYANLTTDNVIAILGISESMSPEVLAERKNMIIEKMTVAKERRVIDQTTTPPTGPNPNPPPAAPPAPAATPTMTQPNASCGVMAGGMATVGATSYPAVQNAFIEGSESGSDMVIPYISPQPAGPPAGQQPVAKAPKTLAHRSVGTGVTLPAGLETGGKIPMKFTNASDFPVYHGLTYTRTTAKKNQYMPTQTPSQHFTTKRVKYLKIAGGAGASKPHQYVVTRALNAFNAAWEEIHACPEAKNLKYGPGDAGQSYQFIVDSASGKVKGSIPKKPGKKPNKYLTMRYFGHKSAQTAIDMLLEKGIPLNDILGLNGVNGKGGRPKRSRLGLSHVSGVGFDIRAQKNAMTKKRIKPTTVRAMNQTADPNWWKSQYNIDVNQVVNQTAEGKTGPYELMAMDHPACITKILKKYGFRWGGDYGSHKGGKDDKGPANTDAMHYEFFGDPRILDQIKAKSYAMGPKNPNGGSNAA